MKKLAATISVGVATVAAACVTYMPISAADPAPSGPGPCPSTDPYDAAGWKRAEAFFNWQHDHGDPQGADKGYANYVYGCEGRTSPTASPVAAPPPVAPPPASNEPCVLTGTQTMHMTPQQLAEWDNAHAKCLGADVPPGQDLVPLPQSPPKPVPNPLSPLDVDCLKLERDLKALPPGADTAAEIATDVPISMMEVGALGLCGIDAAAYNIRSDAKGTKQ